MNQQVRTIMVSLHEHFRIRVTDWLLSAILFSWGFCLLWTDPLVWELPTFSGLADIAPQQTWAVLTMAVGFTRLIALFVNGAYRRSPHWRGGLAFLSCFVWVQLTLGLSTAELAGPGLGIFPWLALADAFNTMRAAADARVSDDRAKDRQRTVAARVPGRA